MNNTNNQVPRRNIISEQHPAELAIGIAMDKIENAGADPLLTDAIFLLQQAKDKVSDFIDGQLKKHE